MKLLPDREEELEMLAEQAAACSRWPTEALNAAAWCCNASSVRCRPTIPSVLWPRSRTTWCSFGTDFANTPRAR